MSAKIEYKKDDWNMCCFYVSGKIPTAQLLVYGTNLSDRVSYTAMRGYYPKFKK